MKTKSVKDLKQMIDAGDDFQLIDCREKNEFDFVNLGGELIPLNDIPANVSKIDRDKPVIIHCRSGARSGNAVTWLMENHGYDNLYNLTGGILAWSDEIDPSKPKY